MTPRLHHDWIDPFAIQIIENLQKAGFQAYLVGGCVRDLLVGVHPKDFDIATNALPQQVKRKVPNSYIIGRRFRLVLVRRGQQQFEVATFRKSAPEESTDDNKDLKEAGEENIFVGDNYFGSQEEDAFRRDFTINALLYDPIQNNLIDHVSGLQDIETRYLRIIGHPEDRLREDPIRILRAVRLSHKLKFQIEPQLRAAIVKTKEDLLKSALPRRREEYLKFLRLTDSYRLWLELFDLQILETLLPGLHAVFKNSDQADIFYSLLNQWSFFNIDLDNPLEIFCAFIQSFATAYYGYDFDGEQLRNEDKFQFMLKEELGMFKNEVSVFFQTQQMIQNLQRVEDHKRRGERRRKAVVQSEYFNLALKLGGLSQQLPASVTAYWRSQII